MGQTKTNCQPGEHFACPVCTFLLCRPLGEQCLPTKFSAEITEWWVPRFLPVLPTLIIFSTSTAVIRSTQEFSPKSVGKETRV